MNPRWLFCLLLFFQCLILWELCGVDGVVDKIVRLHAEIAEIQRDNAKMSARNVALQAEVANLQEKGELLEEAARVQLGMIKKGEIFIQIAPNP